MWLFPTLIYLSDDTEKNPGPKKDFSQTFSIGHWNRNSLVAHNLTKAALLKAYIYLFKGLTSSAYLKQRMMMVCKYLNII